MAVPPNRMTAYQTARAAEGPQRGMTYSELLLDNILGLDNEYLSAGERLGQAINADEVAFLKNAGIGAYEGAKRVVTEPLTVAEEMLTGLYDAGSGLLTEDLNDRLLELYGVGYDQASDEQINAARESFLGDAATVGSVLPVGRGLQVVGDAAEGAIDAAQLAQRSRFIEENFNPRYSPAGAADRRFYYPSRDENYEMDFMGNPTASEELFMQAEEAARSRLVGGMDPQDVLRQTGILPVPLRTTLGADEGYRLIAAVRPEDFTAFRPQSTLNIEVMNDPKLDSRTAGYMEPSDAPGATDRDIRIALNPNASGENRAKTLSHEMTHADLYESDIGYEETGANPQRAYADKMEALKTLDELIRATTDDVEKSDLLALKKDLEGTSSLELYSRNPGEMLARLSEGDTTMLKRLTAMQALNPYLNPRNIFRRVGESLGTALLSETSPMGRLLKRLNPNLNLDDVHVSVPMDMSKAIISEPGYVPRNTAGIVTAYELMGTPDPSMPDPFANVADAFPAAPDALPNTDLGPTLDEMGPADPEAGFIDVEDVDWDEDVVDQMNEGMLRRAGYLPPKPSYELRPLTAQREGIAGLYSPTRKAIDLLDRPSYDNLDSLRVQLLNRGAKPDEVDRVIARAWDEMDEGPMSKERLASLADEAAGGLKVSTRTLDNSPQDSSAYLTDLHFLKGAEDIGANVFEMDFADESKIPDAAFNHFRRSTETSAPLLHTRFGMVYSKGASDAPDTYHLGEIQSDWAQTRAKLPKDYAEIDALIGKMLDSDDTYPEKLKVLMGRYKDREAELDREAIFDDPELKDIQKSIETLMEERESLQERFRLAQDYGLRGEFDANHPAPYVGTTSKWVQLGLRQSLLDAVNKGARQMSLSTGEMVRSYTGGKKGGQSKFYDETVPKELNEVLRKFAKEAGVPKPEIEMDLITTGDGSSYTVPVVRFSDEFIEAVRRVGMPAFAKGGVVKGSYLDVDPFEPAI